MRFIKWSFFLAVLLALLFAGWMVYFVSTPANLQDEVVEVDIRAGSSLRSVSRQLADQGVLSEPNSLRCWSGCWAWPARSRQATT